LRSRLALCGLPGLFAEFNWLLRDGAAVPVFFVKQDVLRQRIKLERECVVAFFTFLAGEWHDGILLARLSSEGAGLDPSTLRLHDL